MDIRSILQSQFHASLDMFERAVVDCPDELWGRDTDTNRTWQLAYHTLFFVHLYLQPTEADFVPREGHRDRYVDMGGDLEGDDEPLGDPVSKASVLEYLTFCRQELDRRIASVDLAAESGFSWLPMTKLELQIYSIRHVMQHTGELFERRAASDGVELPWVGMAGRD